MIASGTKILDSLALSLPVIYYILYKSYVKVIDLFTYCKEQLQEIRNVKLARIICENSDNIESAQVYVMVLPDPDM